ncbi:MAG: hypothetical protein V2A73_17350 [Pseudomonadota bacterium]
MTEQSFECPKYSPLPGGRRCQHYDGKRGCHLPGMLVCREWQRVNGQKPLPAARACQAPLALPSAPSTAAVAQTPAATADRDLFGNPLPELPAKKRAKQRTDQERQAVAMDPPAVAALPARVRPGFTTEDIESFRAMGVQVCVHCETVGDVWLVPVYTGLPRKEITPEHLATIVGVLEAFPGSRVAVFDQSPPETPAAERSPE